jgi:serine/threonine-protein kinase
MTVDVESRYEFLDKIGSGSFATVYRARDTELGREVAVKQIHEQYMEEPQQLERYWQEAQLLASLHHPNIVTIFDIYRDRGWLILELMQANLAERMAGRQMNLTSLRTTIAHALRSLKYLHTQGIVHGDIKPSNLMIDARRRIKLGDFGLARRVSNEEGSMIKGTTKYMAPEVVSDEFGDIGPASDLYSLGFTAYELMCGPNFESLFPGLDAHARNMQAAWMMWHAAPDRRLPEIHKVLEGVPDDLAHVIQKLCAKKQSERYESADEALSDLKVDLKLVKQGSIQEEQPPKTAKSGPDKKRLWIISAAMAFSVILSLFMLFGGPGGDQNQASRPHLKVGIVRNVDADRQTVVIRGIDDETPEEIKLGKKPRIYLLNTKELILLRELKPGDYVQFSNKEDDKGRMRLELTVARPVKNSGTLREVRLAEKQVVLSIEEGNRRETLTLRVPDVAKFRLNGEIVELSKFQQGDLVTFEHIAGLGKKGGRTLIQLDAARNREIVGYVTAYDAANRRLIIRFGQGSSSQSQTLPAMADDCKISMQGHAANSSDTLTPADLRRGDRVRVLYDTRVHEIEVTRDALQTQGVVREVRTETGELIVTDSKTGKPLTFSIGRTTDIRLAMQDVELTELRAYDSVDVGYSEVAGNRLNATTVDAVRPPQTDRWAIVVGIESYEDSFLSPLRYSIRNANHLKQVLIGRYAFKEDRLLMLIDIGADEMRKRIDALLEDASAQTQVLVYFSGHAYIDSDSSVFLAGRDFRFDQMAETGVPLNWLVQRIEKCAAKDKLLLLDCSHLGNQKDLRSQPSTATMVRKIKTPRKTTSIIASCDDGQRGIDWKEKQLSVFAWYVADGFAGAADANRDLRITAQESFDYLKKSMAGARIEGGAKQTPVLFLPL